MAVRDTNPTKAHVRAGPLDGHQIVAGSQLPDLFEVWEPEKIIDNQRSRRVWVYALANGAPDTPARADTGGGDAPAYVDENGFGIYEGIDADRRM